MAVRTPANKGHTYPVETLTSQEMQALLQACSHRAPTGIRNRALLALLWRSGLRISEALALYPRDLDPQQGSVRVRRGKGGKARLVGLDPQAFAMVQRWLDQRHGLGLTGRAPVFCTLAGKPLQTSYIRMLLPRLARRAGIDKRVHAHGLRHTHAAELAAERVPINQIQQQLGHASLATTSRYLGCSDRSDFSIFPPLQTGRATFTATGFPAELSGWCPTRELLTWLPITRRRETRPHRPRACAIPTFSPHR